MSTHDTQHGTEVGYVRGAKHYLLSIEGLPSARVNDMLVSADGDTAVVSEVRDEAVSALLLSADSCQPGTRFRIDNQSTGIAPGSHMIGAILDGLGRPLEGQQVSDGQFQELRFDVKASGIESRRAIDRQLVTGFITVDQLVPIGRGQRELIFGPLNSGKTEFLREFIRGHHESNTVCIYASIGKPAGELRQLAAELESRGGRENAILLEAESDTPTPLIAKAPSVAFQIADHFTAQGLDVTLILDDLGLHAQFLREIALLSGRAPGRESYPGDIFYQHAHLMERGGSFRDEYGGGTLSLLPVMETAPESYTSLIPTNLVACTDGHLAFTPERHAEGRMPAVVVTDSVTRVGRQTQTALQRELANEVTRILSEYPKQQQYSRFGTQLSEHTQEVLSKGAVLHEILDQDRIGPISMTMQLMMLTVPFLSVMDELTQPVSAIAAHKQELLRAFADDDRFRDARERAEAPETDLERFRTAMEAAADEIKRICQS